jgi:quercetin dioxygenase-like cupin family protein
MKVAEVKNTQSKPNSHGVDVRNLSDTEMAQVVHITLQPGESLKKHITPVRILVIKTSWPKETTKML